MTRCKHPHGAYIGMDWICTKCYQKLHERPQRLGMVSLGVRGGDCVKIEARQEIVWQAEILKPEGGLVFPAFIKSMMRRFMHRCKGMDEQGALEIALSVIRDMGVEYGHPEYSWDRAAAIDIADEEVQYFDILSEGNT